MVQELKRSYNSKSTRLSQQIFEDIRCGCYERGSFLPPEKDLAQRYRVARETVRRAVDILSEEKHLTKLPQRGVQIPEQTGDRFGLRATKGTSKLTMAAIWAGEPNFGTTKRLEGIKRYTESQGINFKSYVTRSHEDILDLLNRVEDYSADGVIVYPYRTDAYRAVLNNLIEKKIPVVLTRSIEDIPLSTVMSNDCMGAYQATHYLIEKYARPVYYICEPPEAEAATDRHMGYINAMKDAGFEDLIVPNTFQMERSDTDTQYWGLGKNWMLGFLAAERLLKKVEFPASIFCVNDFTARGVYKAAEKENLVIGKDLAVVGTDDLPLAKLLKPALTTFRASIEELGYETARLLHQIIEKKVQPPIYIHLPMELIIRESA